MPPTRVLTERRLTLEALADVDGGRVIDHNAVVAWVNGLKTSKPKKP